jgi:raffinose/stachyose/melibiose transport system permease protein
MRTRSNSRQAARIRWIQKRNPPRAIASQSKELKEAAIIDGCGRARTFFSIIFPLSKPGLATIGTLAFLSNWNDCLVPLTFLTNSKLKVITLGIQELKGLYIQDLELITAGIVLSFLPAVAMYIIFQEQVIKGLTAGAVKG